MNAIDRSAEVLARRQRRTKQRQEQILDAAEICFLVEGFQGASMSRISAAAKMSVGHIYQYFESKEAMIIALCERRFDTFERLLQAAEQENKRVPSSLVEAWISQFEWWLDPIRAPLTLEILAAAGRNPKIAKVVEKLDHRFRQEMRQNLLPLAGPISNDEIEDRLEAITMLAHGMACRMTADKKASPDHIIAAFRLAVHNLIATPAVP